MFNQRISLSHTRLPPSTSTFQTEETSQARSSSKCDDSAIVQDYSKSSLKFKQLVYLSLVVGVLVIAVAATIFMIDTHESPSSHDSTPSHNDMDTAVDMDAEPATEGSEDGGAGIVATSSKHSKIPKYASEYNHAWFTSNSMCDESDYLQRSLKMQYSANFGGIIMDLQGTYKYEASGVRYDATRDKFFVVFDSLYGLGSIDPSLQRSTDNLFIADSDNGVLGESGFEGLAVDPETNDIYLVTEAVDYVTNSDVDVDSDSDEDDGTPLYRAVISHIGLGSDASYDTLSSCMVEFDFTSENKGLEGLSLLQNALTGEKFFLGLCEGNHCQGGKKGREAGHGRVLIIAFDYTASEDDGDESGSCVHSLIGTIDLPKSVDFTDYSAMAFRKISENVYKSTVVSQEDSAMWVGSFDLGKLEFSEEGEIYMFPRNLDCSTIYCNMEGIDWIDNNTVIAVSDQTKSKGKQQYQCSLGDQSIFVFTIPP